MSLETAGATAPAPLPLQYIDVKITPLLGGRYAVCIQATLLDEANLEFVGEDLADERVSTLEQALAVIRENIGSLAPLAPA